jgi:hypothetical protein
MNKLSIFLLILFSLVGCQAQPINPLLETRYCGFVPRLANGDIKRRADVLTAFQKIHPCPSTGLTTGACPDWSKDHQIPLACSGCDSVSNLAWIPNIAKSCSKGYCKDRYERKIYATNPPIPDTDNCKNAIITSDDLRN